MELTQIYPTTVVDKGMIIMDAFMILYICVCMCVFSVFRSNGLLLSYSEESCEDMSCGEDSPWGSPGSDGEGAFFPSTFLRSKK